MLLDAKIAQLQQKSMWSTVIKPATVYLIAGLAIAAAITGTAYYFYKLDILHNQKFISHITPEDQKISHYSEMATLLREFLNPHDKQLVGVHLDRVKALLPKFDSVKDKDFIEMMNMFIAGHDKKTIKLMNDNYKFWYDVYDKKDYYTQLVADYANVDPKSIDLPGTVYDKMEFDVKLY